MNINEEISFLKNSVNKNPIETSHERRFWEYSLSDKIAEYLQRRNLEIIN